MRRGQAWGKNAKRSKCASSDLHAAKAAAGSDQQAMLKIAMFEKLVMKQIPLNLRESHGTYGSKIC